MYPTKLFYLMIKLNRKEEDNRMIELNRKEENTVGKDKFPIIYD